VLIKLFTNDRKGYKYYLISVEVWMRLRNGRLIWSANELVLLERWHLANPGDSRERLFLRGFSATYIRSWGWIGFPLKSDYTWSRSEPVDYDVGLSVMLNYYKTYLISESIGDMVKLVSSSFSGLEQGIAPGGSDILGILDYCAPSKCRVSINYWLDQTGVTPIVRMDSQIKFRSGAELSHFVMCL
jgi:hypothetical protein